MVKKEGLTRDQKTRLEPLIKEAIKQNPKARPSELAPQLMVKAEIPKEKKRGVSGFIGLIKFGPQGVAKTETEKETDKPPAEPPGSTSGSTGGQTVSTGQVGGSQLPSQTAQNPPEQPPSQPPQVENPPDEGGQLGSKSFPPVHSPLRTSTDTGGRGATPQVTDVTALRVFAMLDQNMNPFEIMQELGVGYEPMHRYVEQYNEMRKAILERDSFTDQRYFGGLFQFAKLFGEPIRDGCQHFNDETGLCGFWNLREVDPQFRKTYPGCFQGVAGGNTRIRVMYHPEVCSLCHQATLFKE